MSDHQAERERIQTILGKALHEGGALAENYFQPSFDDYLDLERGLLGAAATLIARRADGSRERATRMIDYAQRTLEELVDECLLRARIGPRL